mmetsp:Transcript_144195/g.401769  ORF Transcript_144195/g.401769 Transcript_144195/m.401769 type:complete len:423 (+) Transcript_144195:107-1375(+)
MPLPIDWRAEEWQLTPQVFSMSFLILDHARALGFFTSGWASTSAMTLVWSSGERDCKASAARESNCRPPGETVCSRFGGGVRSVETTSSPLVAPLTLDQITALKFRHFVTSTSPTIISCTSCGSSASALEAFSSMDLRRNSIFTSSGFSLTFFTLDQATADGFLQFSCATSAMTMCASCGPSSATARDARSSSLACVAKAPMLAAAVAANPDPVPTTAPQLKPADFKTWRAKALVIPFPTTDIGVLLRSRAPARPALPKPALARFAAKAAATPLCGVAGSTRGRLKAWAPPPLRSSWILLMTTALGFRQASGLTWLNTSRCSALLSLPSASWAGSSSPSLATFSCIDSPPTSSKPPPALAPTSPKPLPALSPTCGAVPPTLCDTPSVRIFVHTTALRLRLRRTSTSETINSCTGTGNAASAV